MIKFKDRYVLGEGYPICTWPYRRMGIAESILNDVGGLFLNYPEELRDKRRPKYHLVLERIEKEKG